MEKKPISRSKAPAPPPAGRPASAGKAAGGRQKAPGRAAGAGPARRPGHHGRFATAINCMDGRTQLPVIAWMKKNLSVDYVDMITEPGPDKLLAEGDPAALDSIRARVLISVNKHGSDTILLVSHDDCAGNPVPRPQHEEQVRQSILRIESWRLPVKRILAVWIGDDWKVRVIEASR